jgi:tetraacyldisaccharide 4'-kinase
VQVRATSTPEQVGDEPLLIFRATGAPVAVGSNRYQAALSLLQLHSELELLVCDDGLQHYGLVRDIEVCVFDNRGCGNGWLLPAGPLREPWARALLPSVGQSASTSLVLHTGTQPAFGGYRATRSLANYAVSRDGQKTELCSLSTDPGKPLFAVAGIAQPQAFFDMLGVSQVPLSGTLGFADHTDFVTLDRNLIENYTLLCTEKDAAKLWQTAPQALAVPLVQTIEPDFYAALDSLLEPLWITKLSSCHGQKTT